MTRRHIHVERVRIRGMPEAPAPADLAARIEAEVARATRAAAGAPRAGDPHAAIESAVRAAAGAPARSGRPR